MSQTISVRNVSGTCYFQTHQTSGACAGVCAGDRTYQMEKTELRVKFQVSSIILTSFRQGVILPLLPSPN